MENTPLSHAPSAYSFRQIVEIFVAVAGIVALLWAFSLDDVVWGHVQISQEPLWYRVAEAMREPFVIAIAVTFTVSAFGRSFVSFLPRWLTPTWIGLLLVLAVYGTMNVRAEWELAPGDTTVMADLMILALGTSAVVMFFTLAELIGGLMALHARRLRWIELVEVFFWAVAVCALWKAGR
jgi:hypothetical protein